MVQLQPEAAISLPDDLAALAAGLQEEADASNAEQDDADEEEEAEEEDEEEDDEEEDEEEEVVVEMTANDE